MRISVIAFFAAIFVFSACGCGPTPTPPATATPVPRIFDGKHAHETYVVGQMNFGARPAGSKALRETGDYILAQLKESKVKTETQEFTFRNVPVRNIVGKLAEGRGPVIILGAHYDTRLKADQDKTNPDQPVLGANDAASGVAVLLELARVLDPAKLKNEVWLAFFDAEDNGDLSGCVIAPQPPCDPRAWHWSVGAEYLAENLKVTPDAVIIADMIGDADQNIYFEHNSDATLQKDLWAIAARLGYTRQFIAEYKWSMDDDHTPFVQRGIRAVDLIDFDYPYWHTTQDTLDKVSGASLERVGRVLQTWLESK